MTKTLEEKGRKCPARTSGLGDIISSNIQLLENVKSMADPTDPSLDPEVAAISQVNQALTPLEPEVQQRVLRWAAERFNVTLARQAKPPARPDQDARQGNGESAGESNQTFADFATLYDAANPQTDAERALVAGYWLQQSNGGQDWDSQSANKQLKNLGHGLSNVTTSLTELMERRPRLVMQTRKEGSSKQARKKYKLTTEGTRKVNQMIGATSSGQESEDGGQG